MRNVIIKNFFFNNHDHWPWLWSRRYWPWPLRELALAFASNETGLGLGLKDYWPWPWPRTCCPGTHPCILHRVCSTRRIVERDLASTAESVDGSHKATDFSQLCKSNKCRSTSALRIVLTTESDRIKNKKNTLPWILPRDAIQARPMPSCGACVSVSLSRSWILSKRINISWNCFTIG